MQRFNYLSLVLACLAGVGIAVVSGCGEVETNCEDQGTCVDLPTGGAGGDGNSIGASGAQGASGSVGAKAKEPNTLECDPTWDPDEDTCVVDEAYGVFVSPNGSDAPGCGTRAEPCATWGQGLTEAKEQSKRLYVCADGGAYEENVLIRGVHKDMEILGGFRCSDWSYDPSMYRAAVEPTEGIALVIENLTAGPRLRDLVFRAADATGSGNSSIGAIVRYSSGVRLINVEIQAGVGAPGFDGTEGSNADAVPEVGKFQGGRDSSCETSADNAGGAWLAEHWCAAGGSTKGGDGGAGRLTSVGLPGGDGTSSGAVVETNRGQGGLGGTREAPGGTNGDDGSPGQAGENGVAAAPGTLSAKGYHPADGHDGTNGHPGQGGGGGGADYAQPGCVAASGGAGGLGGCGGFNGTKGSGGGASIALLAWFSDVVIDSCKLVASAGGKGGDGGNGGQASPGGAGGRGYWPKLQVTTKPDIGASKLVVSTDGSTESPEGGGGESGSDGQASEGSSYLLEDTGVLNVVKTKRWGGRGGDGGPGGSGSGGTGGPSYALAYHASAPVERGTNILTVGPGGSNGTGGQAPNADPAPDGLRGESAKRRDVL